MILKTLSNLSNSSFSKRFPKFKEKIEDWEDRYCQWREYAGPHGFEDRFQFITRSPSTTLSTQKFRNDFTEENGRQANELEIIDFIMDEARNGAPTRLIINDSIKHGFDMDLLDEQKDPRGPQDIYLNPPHFNYLSLRSNINRLSIRWAVIEELHVSHSIKELILENCCIGKILFEERTLSVDIYNSWFGYFNLGPTSIINLWIGGGWLCAINCPPAYVHEENPFLGSVDFVDVNLPTSPKQSLIYKGTQQYRTLRAHFERLQNGPMAGLMRAKELASERESDSGVSWLFNWVYCVASGYGRKPGWAFIWSMVFLALNIMVLTGFDGVRVDSQNLTQGAWQLEWQGDDFLSQFVRASILTLQTVINPFTIFLAKSAFKFKSLYGLIHTFLFVILADAAFVFGSLAIRKRLKFS